jgi:hypothetical protein
LLARLESPEYQAESEGIQISAASKEEMADSQRNCVLSKRLARAKTG